MNLLRVSFTAASHKTFRHNVNTMIRGFATAAGNSESEEQVVEGEKMTYYNTLISDMSTAEELSRADQTRRAERQSPNKVTYMCLMDILYRHDLFLEAESVMYQMIDNWFSTSFVKLKDLRHWFRTRETELIRTVSDEVTHTYTSLINAYLDEGKFDKVTELLHKTRLYSVVINGIDNKKARTTETNKYLLRFNYNLSLETPILEYHRTLVENSSEDDFKSVVEIVESICIMGLENVFDTLLKSNDKLDGIDDGIVYNLFIMSHCKRRNVDEAYIMYKDMVNYGFACHMFTVFALIKTLKEENMVNELRWVIQNVLRSCNLNDSEIVKFLNEFNPEEPDSEALFDVLAEKVKDGLFLKSSCAPPSA